MEWRKDDYTISCDPALLDVDVIYEFLTQRSYWAMDRPRAVLEKSIANSLCFGLYHGDKQVGFARAVSDFATVFWLADVFVLEEYRGQGLGVWLVECVINHPELQGVRGILATRDAHGLYEKFGFEYLENPRNVMRMPKK